MLDDFLKSPGNTQDSLIVAQMPQLQDEASEKVVAAIVSAFASYGVSENRLAFSKIPTEAALGAFEVHLSFQGQRPK